MSAPFSTTDPTFVYVVHETVDPSEPFELGAIYASLDSAREGILEGYEDELAEGTVTIHEYPTNGTQYTDRLVVTYGSAEGENILCTVTQAVIQ